MKTAIASGQSERRWPKFQNYYLEKGHLNSSVLRFFRVSKDQVLVKFRILKNGVAIDALGAGRQMHWLQNSYHYEERQRNRRNFTRF